MRKVVLTIVSLVIFLGSVISVLVLVDQRDFQLRGYVDATETTDLPYRVPRFGVNVELTQYTDAELLQHFDWMEEAQVYWLRQIFDWREIEPEQGQFQWAETDRIVQAVADHTDFVLVAVLVNAPDWAADARSDDRFLVPPENPDDFGNFARAFADRYEDQIDYYQVWDEPNLTIGWGSINPSPADYVALLQSAYLAIRGNDETATVLAAGLAPTVEHGPINISDIQFLNDMYALGASEYMDVVAGKPYGFDSPPGDRTVDENVLNFSRIIALREIMLRYGDGKKALWASNWGWNALPSNWSGDSSIWGGVTLEQQGVYSQNARDRANRQWVWLGGLILYHWQPDALPSDPIWGFAIIDENDRPTALWQSLVDYDEPEIPQDGLFHPLNPNARYSGVWTFSPFGADIGWLETSDSQLAFDFNGRDIALLLREDDYFAFLYPTVDEGQANATPQDNAGNAYIFLRSNSTEPEINLVPVSRDLPLDNHTLRIVADKGWDQWALAGYAVSSGNLFQPYNNQITIAGITAIISGISLLFYTTRLDWHRALAPLQFLITGISQTGQLLISFATTFALMIGMVLTWGDASPALFRREPVNLVLAILTSGVIYLQPAFILTIISAVILFVLIFHRVQIGLVLTIFWSPFFLFPVELFQFAFPIAEIVLLLTFAAQTLKLFADWGREQQSGNPAFPNYSVFHIRQHLHNLDYGVLAFVIIGIASLIWAEQRAFAVTELRTLIFEPALFYLMFRMTMKRKQEFAQIVDVLVIAGVIVALIGLYQYVTGTVITAEEGVRRLTSVYGSPNNVALFLGRCLPFALAFVLVQGSNIRRVLNGIALIIMLLALVLTQSVGAIVLGIPVSVAVVFVLVYGKRSFVPLLGLGILGSVFGFVLTRLSVRFASLLDLTSGTNFIRLRVWESALNIIEDHPITGIGLDQFLYTFRGEYIRPDAIWDADLSHSHNILLDFWLRLSLLGVAILLWIQLSFWHSAKRIYDVFREEGEVVIYAIVVGAMGSMANLLSHGLVDNSVFVIDLAYVFVLLLGLVVNISENQREI